MSKYCAFYNLQISYVQTMLLTLLDIPYLSTIVLIRSIVLQNEALLVIHRKNNTP
jgi:hypothetical protein